VTSAIVVKRFVTISVSILRSETPKHVQIKASSPSHPSLIESLYCWIERQRRTFTSTRRLCEQVSHFTNHGSIAGCHPFDALRQKRGCCYQCAATGGFESGVNDPLRIINVDGNTQHRAAVERGGAACEVRFGSIAHVPRMEKHVARG
jgi:hypothetical protein